jgi:hypothetical protein
MIGQVIHWNGVAGLQGVEGSDGDNGFTVYRSVPTNTGTAALDNGGDVGEFTSHSIH